MSSQHDPVLFRRREAAAILGFSESQVFKWERAGILRPVRVPGVRSVRYRATDIRSLANNIADGRLSTEPATP